VNNDGSIDISDVVALVNMILGNAEKNAAADVNNDGSVDISDVVTLVNMILNGTGTGSDDNLQAYLTCPDENHPHMIDLGLPSGTKWACCNVGATKPEEYGGNYAWEEMKDWGNDTHCDELLKETNRDIANTKHDVAHVKWDGNWQIPSIKQIRELLENCESEWARLNGARGRKFTSKINGNSIFLCAGGNFGDYFPGCGYYLSSTLSSSNKDCIWGLSFDPGYADCIAGFSRQQGYKIRPVSR
jgi:hypothetical protein